MVFEGARYPTGAGQGQGTGKRGKGMIPTINISFSFFIIATCYSHYLLWILYCMVGEAPESLGSSIFFVQTGYGNLGAGGVRPGGYGTGPGGYGALGGYGS